MKRNNVIAKIVLPIMLITFVSFLAFYIINLDNNAILSKTPSASQKPVKIITGWEYCWGDSPINEKGTYSWLDNNDNGLWSKFQFPGKLANPDNQRSIWIRTTLPYGNWKNPTLRFRAPQQCIEIYLDNKLIYNFGKIDNSNTKTIPGSIWHLVPLPDGFQGKTVYFRIYSPLSSYTSYLIEIEAGTKADHILNILKENGCSLILGFLFVFFGIVSIVIYLLGPKEHYALFSLGFSSICIGVWFIAECKVLQLFSDTTVAPVYIANLSVFLMPIGFISFMEQVFTERGSKESRVLTILWRAFAALTVIAFLTDMLHIASSLKFNIVLHILIAFSIIPILAIIIKSAKKGNKEAWIFIVGILVLFITGIYDIYIMFYNTAAGTNPVKISEWGMFGFIISLATILGRRFSALNEKLKIALKENETNYKSLFKNMADGFLYNKIIYNEKGMPVDCTIIDTNPAFEKNTCFDKNKVIGMKLSDILPTIDILDLNYKCLSGETFANLEKSQLENHLKLGKKWYKVSSFSPLEGYISILLTDITEMKNAENIIRQHAYTDSMTSFYNRTYFEEIMTNMEKKMDGVRQISLIVIDIDGLKITNDTFGHKTGDELLIEASKIISVAFESENSIISRVGGDEFCIILPGSDLNYARKKREMISELIDKANSENRIVPISMSIGVASSNKLDNNDIYAVYRRADDDMYQYKLSQSGSEKSKVIDMLLTALSERDYVSQGHVERLTKMAGLMADVLDLHDIERRNLILLSKVHDLGKIGISDKILLKPGKLTEKEYEIMKQHSKIGFNIANRSKELAHIANLILHHHERWDGNGYPDELKKGEIPLECRILAIIDAYDAMTSTRPYHTGISKENAISEIKRCSGKQFDPSLSEKFISIASKLPKL